jgi:hypothetical protein
MMETKQEVKVNDCIVECIVELCERVGNAPQELKIMLSSKETNRRSPLALVGKVKDFDPNSKSMCGC